ncbi:3-(3-hydroxy-phenyl)propionate hydroxylase [Paraburkholderia sp. GV068]|uniref:bifunctional 3-(3-hydroxy-phenyl)propionate/3-hydroxycinnamic acid hydroxylase n=1 Tax=Paraburkholderia TaxID=1822464 RepID=UPI000D2FF530|nr:MULTISPECIES: bifunctional 3-(3-hydroxy-phenyl)propionate/3-hydroxycinnamic acid hydroxylase [unclassified Paraburkholderia]PTQ93052.1 3-(3-hydroxy-phenyl)propionate hydroxylase [Paraburkholderia sp. GV072]PUA99783.1 3-(3-hydroxy-phenyl)propionate hydroxylase [Paraburkholderia sp. GV068]
MVAPPLQITGLPLFGKMEIFSTIQHTDRLHLSDLTDMADAIIKHHPKDDLYDVVLIGYGPVGATLANLLAAYGLSVAVVEREAGVYHLARAGHFDAEVMRVLQGIGVADEVESQSGITLGMRFLDADGALLMEWKRGGEKGPHGWVSDYMFHQPDLERTLRKKLASAEKVQSFLLHDVYAIEQEQDFVRVNAEDTANARLVQFRGRYVVGCEGARSLVRRTIGSEHENLGFKQRWLVVDVKELRDLALERVSTQHCNPQRPMYASCTAHGMLRWEIMLRPEDDTATVTRENAVWDFIENSVRPINRGDGEITRAAVYTFESLIARQWRDRRLLLAGDSAHRMPPFLGQGMCAGIRDAANLAWKLAAVCQGRADDGLLDTYEAERVPHVRAFMQGAIEAGQIVQMADPEALAERARDMRANPKAYAPPNPALGAGLNPRYGEAGLGRQFVQPFVDGRLVDDIIGHSFALVVTEDFVRSHGDPAALQKRFAGLKVVVLPAESESALNRYHAPALLLRPDRYVHAAIQDLAQLQATLDELPVRLG